MIVKLLTEHNLEFLSLKGGCTSSSESTFVKTSNCWKFHAAAQMIVLRQKQCLISPFILVYQWNAQIWREKACRQAFVHAGV